MRNSALASFVLLLIASVVLGVPAAQSSERVANYSTGRYGTSAYEHFSFWVKTDGRLEISYSYGKSDKELAVDYGQKETCQGRPCFTVRFSNGRTFHIRPAGLNLKITDDQGHYSKLFRWEYEGPRDGRGTFCQVCAADEKEAMTIVKNHFLR